MVAVQEADLFITVMVTLSPNTCAVPATPKILTPLLMLAATRFASPAKVTAPVVYLPAATAVLAEVPGVMVAPASVVSCLVALLVPAATYPAPWVTLAVMRPLEPTEMPGVAWSAMATLLLTASG